MQSFERVEKADTLSRDKHNHCGKALFCVFPPTPLFQSKTGSARGRRLCSPPVFS